MRERRIGWERLGVEVKIWEGLTISHVSSTRLRLFAVSACWKAPSKFPEERMKIKGTDSKP